MNHPDRVVEPGSGVKNRYRTIIPSKLRLYLSQSTKVKANPFVRQLSLADVVIGCYGLVQHTRYLWQCVSGMNLSYV